MKKPLFIAAVLLAGWLIAPLYADDESTDKIIDAFVASVQSDDSLSPAIQDEVKAAVAKLREDEYGRLASVTEGLRITNESFRAALLAIEEDRLKAAADLLQPLVDSDNSFLAADSAFYLARVFVYQERYEDALPYLRKVTSDFASHSLSVGDALFLQGVAESEMLNRTAAIAALKSFLDKHPEASERMRVGAWRQLEQLKSLEEGSITDVFERMDFSRRRLGLGDSGEQTQAQQDKVIDMLAQLIKDAEQAESEGKGQSKEPQEGNEKKEGSGGGSPGEGTGKNGEGGNDQSAGAEVRRTFRRGPQSPWHKVRDKERDPAYNAIKTRFPARYEELIKQYYESFQSEGS